MGRPPVKHGPMKDATGQHIHQWDLVEFNAAATRRAHGDYALALKTLPGGRNKLCALCADGTKVPVMSWDVTVADRSYLYRGMSVTPASDVAGQAGIVTGVDTRLDLVNQLTGERTTKVAADPRRVGRGIRPYDYVVSGTWIGLVAEVTLDVDVLFDDGDGAVCRVTDAGKKLRTVDHNEVSDGLFIPGQRVVPAGQQGQGNGGSVVFKSSRWLKGYWKPSRSNSRGTVAKKKVSGVLVHWLASSEYGTDFDPNSAPPAYQRNSDNLTVFNTSTHYNFWAVSDRCCFLRRRHDDDDPTTTTASTSSASNNNHAACCTRGRLRRRRRRTRPAAEPVWIVTGTHTTADVLWQDGTRQQGVPSTSLVHSFEVWDAHEFIPGSHVISSSVQPWSHDDAADNEPAAAATPRSGIVRSFNHRDKTARVSWLDVHKDDETIVSAYDLNYNPDQALFHGMVVVRLRPTKGLSEGGGGQKSTQQDQLQKRRNKQQLEEDFSWVGYIVDHCDAPNIQVQWGDGNVSNVLLHEVAVIDAVRAYEIIHEMGDWVSDNDDDDAAQAEDVDDEHQDNPPDDDGHQADDDSDDNSIQSDVGEEDGPAAPPAAAPRTTMMGLAGAAALAMIRLAGSVLDKISKTKRYIGFRGSTSTDTAENAKEEEETPAVVSTSGNNNGGSQRRDQNEEAAAATAPDESGSTGEDGGSSAGRLGKNKAEADTVVGDRFPNFDVVLSPPDHHYLDNTEQVSGGGGRKWTKRVQKEWKILGEDNLPDTIYVRAFEDRMDLLRAAMVGASGTPYQDGLFFFDLQLPPTYPAVPPLVSYRSFGLRVNPNLYESGTVCLSLLDTFDGEGAELWSPESSSVLQVVVSIQGLVLTALPYYNEAGYAAHAGEPDGRRNELPYSENAYLLSLQTMLHLLRRPPKGFEALVRDHFRRRGRHVLRACEAYMDGCTVATLDCEARPTERSRERTSSAGFKLALANLVPRLVHAFKELGADGLLCDV